MIAPDSFFDFKLPNILTLISILIAYLHLRRSSKNDAAARKREWRSLIEEQTKMHTENRLRMDALIKFQSNQETINSKRDLQVEQLLLQTTKLGEMASGFNRRLVMLEDHQRREKQ